MFESVGSTCAQASEGLAAGGGGTVHRVTAAICGDIMVHSNSVMALLEGAGAMGRSSALGEGRSGVDGAVVATHGHSYSPLTRAQTPSIGVHIVPSAELPGGGEEPELPPAPAALCNGIGAATGRCNPTLPVANQLES